MKTVAHGFQNISKLPLPITLDNSPSDVNGLPIHIPIGSKPMGGVFDGKIYIFTDNLPSNGNTVLTVFHEIFHYGLQKVVPAEEYATLLAQFAKSAAVQKLMDQWKASTEGKQCESPRWDTHKMCE